MALFKIVCIQFLIVIWCCISSQQNIYCDKSVYGKETCTDLEKDRYIFYDVNPPEGFNLRRDVYLRLSMAFQYIVKVKRFQNLKLVLPPWNSLYHWRSMDVGPQKRIPWGLFFNIQSLKKFAPVVEMHDIMKKETPLVIDRIYVMKRFSYKENSDFQEKMEVKDPSSCKPDGVFWGYSNITYKSHVCIQFQGSAQRLIDIIDLYPEDSKIMITNAELALHDEYGTKLYWEARRSMQFSIELFGIAEDFMVNELECDHVKCNNYLAIHWRRGDFALGRSQEVPSVQATAIQIHNYLNSSDRSPIKTIFIATDAMPDELDDLINYLLSYDYIVKKFTPSLDVHRQYMDGGVAIIDQIICSHAAYFIGTYESTFTFRIQEEREILKFNSATTFNRFCPDKGSCPKMSRWTLVN